MTSLFLYLSATIYREKESKDMDENKAKEEQTKVSKETNEAVDNSEETETEEDQNEERNSEDDFWGAKRPAIKNQQSRSLLV